MIIEILSINLMKRLLVKKECAIFVFGVITHAC